MLIGGLDIGTTGCKLTVYESNGDYVHNSYVEYDVSRLNGEHEIDGDVIFSSVCAVIRETAAQYDLSAIGVTSFGETFAALDGEDNILLPLMLYTDPRGEKECEQLCAAVGEERLVSVSGTKPHRMYSLPKIMWIKSNLPDTYRKIKRIVLMEDYIVYKLSGKAQIDYSLAARTMGFDIKNKCWSKDIFAAAGIDLELMSAPVPTGTLAGNVLPRLAEALGISPKTKIVSGCHDQVAAAVGSGVFGVGQAVDGTGTVECVTPVFDSIPSCDSLYREGYSVVPYIFNNTYVCYALSFTGGAALKWYRDNFAVYENIQAKKNGENIFAMLDKTAPAKPTGLLVLPHFAGAANPYMDIGSRAAIIGLTLETTSADIYKALMEGVTYEIMTNLEHMESFGINPEVLFAAGGGASSDIWLQIKADILNRPITSLLAKEVGACGTCMLAGVAAGAFRDIHEAKNILVKYGKTYMPNSENTARYRKNFEAYKKIYKNVRPIIEEIAD